MSEPPITIQAASWNFGGGQPVPKWIVIHDEEYPVCDTSAEAIARMFRDRPYGSYGSAHYITDRDSEQHSVPESHAAYHAPNLSFMGSIGIEQDGYARYSRADWLTPGSVGTIGRTAARCAELCKRHAIPAAYVSATGLNAGVHGITSHVEVNHSRWGAGDHWDPGYNFPWTEFFATVSLGMEQLKDVRAFQAAHGLVVDGDPGIRTILALGTFLTEHFGGSSPPKPKAGYHRFDGEPTIRLGAQGGPVSDLQAALNKLGVPPLTSNGALKVDGDFGPYTERTVRLYQSNWRLVADGIVGPATWLSLAHQLTDRRFRERKRVCYGVTWN